MKIHRKIRCAFTMVELMITVLIAMLVIAGIGVAMIDSIRSFPLMNERAQGDVVTDAYVAKAAFDAICRKSSYRTPIGTSGTFVEVYYYNNVASPSLDRYAQFRVSGGALLVDRGIYVEATKSKTLIGTETLAKNVTAAQFEVQGTSIVMALHLKKGNQEMTITCASVRHNW